MRRMLLAALLAGCASPAPETKMALSWKLDSLESIGGHPTAVLGSPKIVQTPAGRAVEFDGVKDGLQVGVHPMEGWSEFTLEVLFRPDAGGLPEQRFLHLQEEGSENRILIETRLTDDGRWFLDTYIKSGDADQTLLAKGFFHPVGKWHPAALVFDGKEMRHYVNGVLELSGPLRFAPPRKGLTSIGVRANRVFWFKGAIREIRMTPRALGPADFLRAE